ncbi:MAG: hypothetical protein AAGA75_23430 [Cyanobacteria bacterium P01_E01_bin.6]
MARFRCIVFPQKGADLAPREVDSLTVDDGTAQSLASLAQSWVGLTEQ